MKRVNIYITPKQETELSQLSDALGVKRSAIVRSAIDEYKENHGSDLENFLIGLAEMPESDSPEQKFIKECKEDKIFFIENALKIRSIDRGLIPFELYDYQSKLVDMYDEYDEIVINKARQMGITTLIAALITHYILFNNDKLVAIGSPRVAYTMEILRIIRIMLDSLPSYMVPKLRMKNKQCIQLEDTKSRVIIISTFEGSVRGIRPDMIYLDEPAYITRRQFDEFFSAVYPTIASSDKTTKFIIASSTNGYNSFCNLWHGAMCNYNNFKPVKLPYTLKPERDEHWADQQKQIMGYNRFKQEYLCEFVDDEKYPL